MGFLLPYGEMMRLGRGHVNVLFTITSTLQATDVILGKSTKRSLGRSHELQVNTVIRQVSWCLSTQALSTHRHYQLANIVKT